MSDSEYERKLDELDRLLNDPEIPMQPARVWSLLAEISRHHLQPPARATPETSAFNEDPHVFLRDNFHNTLTIY